MLAVFVVLAATIAAMFGIGRLLRTDYARVTPRTLVNSVTREAGGNEDTSKRPCERSEGRWTCLVPSTSGHGTAGYRVEMDDEHCWTADKTVPEPSGGSLAENPSGCVTVDDRPDAPESTVPGDE
jgi:hypothetical protein